ncbi:MAG: hypothetical protein ABL867_10020 [Rickettsiales bacterium]
MTSQPQGKNLMMIVLVIILAVVGFYALNAPDTRTGGEKIGDAIDELGDRSLGERIGDDLKKK